MTKHYNLVEIETFQKYILNLWKDSNEINKIMENTNQGNEPLFQEGFKFGLIWASLSMSQIANYRLDIPIESDDKK